MADQETSRQFDSVRFIEHQRAVNRQFDNTPEKAAERLDACFIEQLKELGLLRRYYREESVGEPSVMFDYVDPRAIRVVIDAFMSGKLPQPVGPVSFLFSERTALGRQAALDTAIEKIKSNQPYDVTTDYDFFPEIGNANG